MHIVDTENYEYEYTNVRNSHADMRLPKKNQPSRESKANFICRNKILEVYFKTGVQVNLKYILLGIFTSIFADMFVVRFEGNNKDNGLFISSVFGYGLFRTYCLVEGEHRYKYR